jgi:septal ring factor EnvC (AmiA/AmiB activator)
MKRISFFLLIVAFLCMAVQCDRNCTQCEAEKTALQQQVASLSQQLQDCQTTQTANQAKIDDLTHQLEECDAESQADQAKILLLTQQLSECNSQADVYRAKIAELTQLLQDCESADLAQQLEDCKAANTALQQQITVLNQQLASCNTDKAVLQQQIDGLNQQLASCNSERTALISQLATCNSQNSANQVRIAELTQQLADCQASDALHQANIAELTQMLNDCNTENDANKAKIADLNQQLAVCNTQAAALAQQLASCNSERTALTNQLATCNTDKTALTNQLAACNSQITALNQQLASCNTDKTALINQLAACNSQNTANQVRIAELTQQVAILTQQLAICNTENDANKAKIVLLTQENQALKDSLENCGSSGTAQLWAYTYLVKSDSSVFNFWYSSEVSAPYQTRTSVGSITYDQYYKVNGYDRMYNKSLYALNANAAYLDVIIYDSTFTKVLYNGQYNLPAMSPQTEYKFEWNTGDFTLPYLGTYYMSKVLYEKKTFRDRPLEGGYFTFEVTDELHTIMKMKTYPETDVMNIPEMKIYVDADTIYFPVKLDKVDSTYVVYINQAFDDIDSIKFTADTNLVLASAYLSSMNLLNNPTIKVNGLTYEDGVYKILVKPPTPPVVDPLTARWRFEQNGNDETGDYPATISNPVNMFANGYPCEGAYYLSTDGSGYTAVAPAVPLGDEFTICLWYRTWNQNDGMPILGNSKVYYPDGYILYADGVTSKMFKFVTSDGTSSSRKYIMSVDGVLVTGSKWNHIVITGSKTNPSLGKMYINGVDKTRGSSTGVFSTFKNNLPLYLGRSSDSQGWCYVDDVRYYNRILTQEEITKVYNKQDL